MNEYEDEYIKVDDLWLTLDEKEFVDFWINKIGRYKPTKRIKPKADIPIKKKTSKWQEVDGYPLLEWIEKNDKLIFRYGQKKIEPRYVKTEKRWIIYFKVGYGVKSETYRLYIDEILPNVDIKMKTR